MSSFDAAIETVLAHEGGYVHDPNDSGGETKYGISKKAFPNLDIQHLTIEEAKDIYRTMYWNHRWAEIHDQALATELLDCAVNMGVKHAVTLLQRALARTGCRVVEDGIFGEATLTAIYKADPKDLLDEFKTEQIIRYIKLAEANPNNKAFVRGWVKRAVA